MAKAIRWENTTEWNPVLAVSKGKIVPEQIKTAVDGVLLLEKNSVKYKPTIEESKTLSLSIIPDVDALGIHSPLDQIYAPGPQAETFLFWGKQHIELIDGKYVYMSIFAVPNGEVVYHVVPSGKTATVTRIQCYNTLNKEVTISFFVGLSPFESPRLRSDILIAPLEDYDLSCSIDATEGESLGMVVSDEKSIRVAISGHLNDVVIP